MARSRNIKPGFFQNEQLGELDPIARLAFIGMWTVADFKGCLEFRPKRLKIQLLPYDDCDLEKIAINLDKSGLIRLYSVQGNRFIKILKFEEHQNPHKNERDAGSEIPDYDENYREINELEKIENNREQDGTNRADSLLLIPDSFNLIPDSIKPQAAKAQAPKFDFLKSLLELGVEEKNALAWIQVRKAKKAPNSDVALQALVREADKAGLPVNDAVLLCAERNWQSFKAEWILPKSTGVPAGNHPSGLGVHGQATARAAQEWLASKERERNEQQ